MNIKHWRLAVILDLILGYINYEYRFQFYYDNNELIDIQFNKK